MAYICMKYQTFGWKQMHKLPGDVVQAILDIVRIEKNTTVVEITKRLSVRPYLARSWLNQMAKRGLLVKRRNLHNAKSYLYYESLR